MNRDPVCGNEVDALRARAVVILSGRTCYFCSQAHADEFRKAPERFTAAPAAPPPPARSAKTERPSAPPGVPGPATAGVSPLPETRPAPPPGSGAAAEKIVSSPPATRSAETTPSSRAQTLPSAASALRTWMIVVTLAMLVVGAGLWIALSGRGR